MSTPRQIKNQFNELLIKLIQTGLSSDQNFPFERKKQGGEIEVAFPGAEHTSVAMKDVYYPKIYQHLERERAFLVKMLDGGLIQMMYEFKNERLKRHRLAFFSSPYLEKFQNNPEIYIEDEVYADIIAKNIVSFPIRFDYDASNNRHIEMHHPKSHLTLGQYQNCRIPVSAPLMPHHFMDFILRNFYNTAHRKYSDQLNGFRGYFPNSIVSAEKEIIHVQIPTG
ncbi:MAG: DUF2290 domain-containing protein [Deltaproteobacteria bacterium]|nr:MAG: DUF2290 domain-containing protein [Deltaproteobacteria bacterium]